MEPFYLMSYYVMLRLENKGGNKFKSFKVVYDRYKLDGMCCLPHTQLFMSPLNKLSCAGIKYPLRAASCLLCHVSNW